MELACTSLQILNEVQIQTTKQVYLGTEDQFRDGNKKAAILDFKIKIFERARMTILYVYMIVLNKALIAL